MTDTVNGTDLTYANLGYSYTGEAEVQFAPPVAEPPLGAFPSAVATPVQRVHHATPTLVLDNGRPVFDGLGTVTYTPWIDHLRITVGGKDVTWFRDYPTKIDYTQHLDPYGDAAARLVFPQITEFEARGTGALSWLKKTARVTINKVVSGVVVDAADPYFDGIVARIPTESGPVTVECDGNYIAREGRKMHQPYAMHNPARTLKDHLVREHEKLYRKDFSVVGSVTGPTLRNRGSRDMTRLNFVDSLLGMSGQEDGDTYTLMPDRSVARNAMRLKLRTMATVTCTVYAGAHGVKITGLDADLLENRLYGEGQSPNGGRWRNLVAPNAGYDDDAPDFPGTLSLGDTDADTPNSDGVTLLNRRLWGLGLLDSDDAPGGVFDDATEGAVNDFRRGLKLDRNGIVNESLWGNLFKTNFNQQSFQGAHFEPIAAADETVQFLRGPGGNVVGKNPEYRRAAMPVEGFRSYGENVSKQQAKRHGRGEIARSEILTGTITLSSDPAEKSRFDIRAGETMKIVNLLGTGATGLKVYISSAERNHGDGSVTLAVATSPLHFIELSALRQRQIEAKQDAAKRARLQIRRSTQVSDKVIGWEADGMSGVIPRRHVAAGSWKAFQVWACEYGTLAWARFECSTNTKFWVLATGQKIPESVLNRRLGNPSTWRGIDAGRSFGDGNTTSGSTILTSAAANFVEGDEGRALTGPGIPADATVSDRLSGSKVRMSQAATATASGVNVTLGAIDDDRQTVFDANHKWLLSRLYVDSWGQPDQPLGYWPRKHTNDRGKTTNAPLTGLYVDAGGGLEFATTGGFLWVYVWADEDTTFSGRLKLQNGDL